MDESRRNLRQPLMKTKSRRDVIQPEDATTSKSTLEEQSPADLYPRYNSLRRLLDDWTLDSKVQEDTHNVAGGGYILTPDDCNNLHASSEISMPLTGSFDSDDEDDMNRIHNSRLSGENGHQENDLEEMMNTSTSVCCSDKLRPFMIISTSYLFYSITDGALRMIVCLRAYDTGFDPLEVAMLFTLYECAGIITNLTAGMLGAKWSIKRTLVLGLCSQLFGYCMLFFWKDEMDVKDSIIYAAAAQIMGGIAKDLTKLGGRAVSKLVTPQEKSTHLFKLVSRITCWKNTLMGLGYFAGGALLMVSFHVALVSMICLILCAMTWTILGLDSNIGTTKKENASFSAVFSRKNPNLSILSVARLFLFASRGFWFEVSLPYYLRSPSCDGLGDVDYTCAVDDDCEDGAICNSGGICANQNIEGGCGGVGWNLLYTATFLGAYILLYGQIQSWILKHVTNPRRLSVTASNNHVNVNRESNSSCSEPNKSTEMLWGAINCLPLALMALVLFQSEFFHYDEQYDNQVIWLIAFAVLFAFVFAVNSSIHSYLVVRYAKTDNVAVSMGLYSMSNAIGRSLGTIGSGLLFGFVGEDQGEYAGSNGNIGLAACFLAGMVCSVLAVVITGFIDDTRQSSVGALRFGSFVCVTPRAAASAAIMDSGTTTEEAANGNVANAAYRGRQQQQHAYNSDDQLSMDRSNSNTSSIYASANSSNSQHHFRAGRSSKSSVVGDDDVYVEQPRRLLLAGLDR